MVFARDRSGWRSHILQRLALLQEQLLRTRDALGRAKFDAAKASDQQSEAPASEATPATPATNEIAALEKREATLVAKVATCRAEAEADAALGAVGSNQSTDDLLAIFTCDVCGADISGTRFGCFDLCVEFDACRECAPTARAAVNAAGQHSHEHFGSCRGGELLVEQPLVQPVQWGIDVQKQPTLQACGRRITLCTVSGTVSGIASGTVSGTASVQSVCSQCTVGVQSVCSRCTVSVQSVYSQCTASAQSVCSQCTVSVQ